MSGQRRLGLCPDVATLATSTLSPLQAVSRLLLRRSVANPMSPWPVILMYHAIDPPHRPSGWEWAITADRFVSHLDLLDSMGVQTLRLDEVEEVSDKGPSVVITFDDGYADNHEWALPELVRRGQTATWFISSACIGGVTAWRDGDTPRRAFMDLEQIRELVAAGMEIGGHSRHHASLVGLSADEIESEVVGCREDLEAMLGVPVASFAYPYGRHDDFVRSVVGRAGYRYSCTTKPGWWRSESDRLQLRRVTVRPDDTCGILARKLCLADNDGRWRVIARYFCGRIRPYLLGRRA